MTNEHALTERRDSCGRCPSQGYSVMQFIKMTED